MTDAPTEPSAARPAFDFDWLTPTRCRLILAVVLLVGFLGHVGFLLIRPPLDLSGDEAHYWDWSRQLDLAYYSKPPGVALLIRASTEIFGDTMFGVRFPALLLAAATSIVTYMFTRQLFGSEKLALGTALLTHTVPIYVVGSFLMTIDPPVFLCWAIATTLLARAIQRETTSLPIWLGIGLVVAIGLIFKLNMATWLICAAVALLVDARGRRLLRSLRPLIALPVAALGFLPTLIWNIQNDFVTFKHVSRQTGVTNVEGAWYLNPLEMIASQFGVVGPILAGFVIFAVVAVVRRERPTNLPARRFLLAVGGSYFAIVFLASFRTNIEANWPAPAYFTLVILAAEWLAARTKSLASWRGIRGFFWTHLAIAGVVLVVVHRSDWLYPFWRSVGVEPRRVDSQFIKMRGNAEVGQAISEELARLPPGTIVIAPHYQIASLAAFYTAGHPTTYCIGSFFRGSERLRFSQFDRWERTDLTDPNLVGRDAIYVGHPDAGGVVVGAFDSFVPLRTVEIEANGVVVRTVQLRLGRNFKGVRREPGGTH